MFTHCAATLYFEASLSSQSFYLEEYFTQPNDGYIQPNKALVLPYQCDSIRAEWFS